MAEQSSWQDVLDPQFVQRLLMPWQRPGRLNPEIANAIFARYQHPMTPLPLVEQLIRRQQRIATRHSDLPPIVYAQPVQPTPSVNQVTSLPTLPRSSQTLTVVQAKFITSAHPSISPPSRLAALSQPKPLPLQPPPLPFPARSPLPSIDSNLTPPLPPTLPISPNSQFPLPTPLLNRPVKPQCGSDEQVCPTHPPIHSPTPSPIHPPTPPPLHPSTPAPLHSSTPPTKPLLRQTISTSSLAAEPDQFPVVVAMSIAAPKKQSTDADLPQIQIGQLRSDRQNKLRPIPMQQLQESVASLPLVQTFTNVKTEQSGQAAIAQPLVFSTPAAIHTGTLTATSQRFSDNGDASRSGITSHGATNGVSKSSPPQPVPIVNAETVRSTQQQFSDQSTVDVEELTNKIEKKLIRRLTVERERRGWKL